MIHPGYSRMEWWGLVLIFIGIGTTPLAIVAFQIFRGSITLQDYGTAVLFLLAVGGNCIAAGLGVLGLESVLSRRKSR
jgi:hypothetical protein